MGFLGLKKKHSRGQMLVELLLAIGVSAILLPALVTGLVASRNGKPQQQQRIQAIALLKQTEEAIRSIRNSGWTNFATNGTHHPVIQGTSWMLSPGTATLNGFTQQVVISDVYRDNNGAIVASGSGMLDPSTKKVVASVSWLQPIAVSVQSTTYLTRYLDNITFTDTTVADFTGVSGNMSNLVGTAITDTDGGNVELGAGNADWCSPQDFIVNQIKLPKLSNAVYAVPGHAWLGAGDGTAGSPEFINVAIDAPPPPASPSASVVGTFNGSYTTNVIYSDGTYVYLGTTDPTNQVVILDISKTPYQQVGTVTVPGGLPANGVFLSSNILYITSGNYLYTYNMTTKTGSHTTPLKSIKMYAGWFSQPSARQVYVVNNIAYVATGGSFLGLQIIKVSNGGSTLTFQGASNFTWNQQSQGLYVNSAGTRAYVAFNNGDGFASQGFEIVDVSKPAYWLLVNFYGEVGHYSTSGMDPRGIAVVSGNRAIVVGTGGFEQYQVIDISNEKYPSRCGGMSISGGVYGIASILDEYENAYSYITTGDTSNQFKIIQGGNGGRYSTEGTFESSIFKAGYSTAFNRFSATVDQPSQTTIQLQVAVAPPVDNSCTNAIFNYVGPNGIGGSSPSAYFVPDGGIISGAVPFGTYDGYQNPNRCFRYKARLTTSDTSQTPVLHDMTVNYSP